MLSDTERIIIDFLNHITEIINVTITRNVFEGKT
jgi:hypothetical protein